MEPTSSLNRGERKKGSSLVTGSEVQTQASGASCFITTDSEKSLVSRQASQVEQIELRTYVFLIQNSLEQYRFPIENNMFSKKISLHKKSCIFLRFL